MSRASSRGSGTGRRTVHRRIVPPLADLDRCVPGASSTVGATPEDEITQPALRPGGLPDVRRTNPAVLRSIESSETSRPGQTPTCGGNRRRPTAHQVARRGSYTRAQLGVARASDPCAGWLSPRRRQVAPAAADQPREDREAARARAGLRGHHATSRSASERNRRYQMSHRLRRASAHGGAVA